MSYFFTLKGIQKNADLKTVEMDVIVPKHSYRPRYMILRDPSVAEVLAASAAHPKVFVFTFVTRPINDLIDYSDLYREDDPTRHYIAMPFYVGDLSPIDEAIRQYLENVMGPLSECDEVLA